jgi:4-methylaminobutanoate oxidase (formaldehyde-forming)
LNARVVIVGGGAVGCAIAWQLACLGERDVLLLEKSGITHGSTWHAAGLVGQYRSRADLTRLMRSSVVLMDEIEAETPMDWRQVGSLRIASSQARWEEYRAAEPLARSYGVSFELIGPAEARIRFPYLALDGVVGAAFVAGDGYVDPSSMAQAFAARARALGVRVAEGATVDGFERKGDRVTAVRVGDRRIVCETVVLATGMWSRPVGRMLGLDLPVATLVHQYAVTDKSEGVSRDLPTLRDPDLNFYLKPEAGGFAIGGWEADTIAAFDGKEVPMAFGPELLPENLDRLAPILAQAARRLPVVDRMGIRRVIAGPIPITPDGEPILGPAPGFANLHLAVGFTAGIAAAGGAGRALAEWIVEGEPRFELPSLDPRRFGQHVIELEALNARAIATYGCYYALSQHNASEVPR